MIKLVVGGIKKVGGYFTSSISILFYKFSNLLISNFQIFKFKINYK